MSEQSMPAKLELIAKCIREGREVEYNCGEGWVDKCVDTIMVSVLADSEYRAKPEKPRKGTIVLWDEDSIAKASFNGFEDTPEVRQVLEDAGLI